MGYVLDLRKKIGHEPIIMASAGAIIVNEKGEILLGKRTDNGFWDYPAGSMEPEYSLSVPTIAVR